MSSSSRPLCVLCFMSEENKDTGPLATKDDITAHENCLLYASGIYCKNSPVFDDLFGFSVEDVKQECRRGKKLRCHACRKRGATAGCEVKRCPRSYHYPCAVRCNAQTIENHRRGVFQLFCEQHRDCASGSVDSSMATTSSVQNGGAATPRPGSKVRQEVTSLPSKKRRRLFSGDEEEDDDDEDVSLIPPIESDVEDSQQSTGPEVTADRSAATATPQRTDMSASCGLDGDETDIESDGPSESLLPDVSFGDRRETDSPEPATPTALGDAAAPHPAPGSLAPGAPHAPGSLAPGAPYAPGSLAPDAPGDAEEFWSRCNEAGCTETIFKHLTDDLSSLAQRIHNQQATRQECVMALKVLQALKNSEEIMSQLEEELEEDERKLQQRRKALRAARGALTPDQH